MQRRAFLWLINVSFDRKQFSRSEDHGEGTRRGIGQLDVNVSSWKRETLDLENFQG